MAVCTLAATGENTKFTYSDGVKVRMSAGFSKKRIPTLRMR